MTKIPKIKLGKIAKFQQGLQVDVDCQFYSKEENYVQFLRIVDYTNNEEKPRFIEQIKDSPSIVNKNDVVMIRYGSQTAGKVVIGKEGIIANNMFRIIPTINEIEKRYLYYFLKNQTIYNFLMNGQSSSTMPAITFGMMYDVDILLPEIVVQQKIASILSALDSKIELNNRINTELEAMAKTIYDYWFVQFEFPIEAALAAKMGDPNLIGKPYKTSGGKMVWNEELKREIPEGWEVNTLSNWIKKDKSGDWGKEEREGNYSERVFCIRGADLNGLNGKGEVKAPERYILEKNSHKMLDPHDLIVEISGGSPTQSTGRMAYMTKESLARFDAPVICSNFCKAVTLKDEKSLYNFAFEWNNAYDHGVLFGYEGKTSGIKNLLFESFVTSYYTPIPSNHLMEKFYDFMTPLEIRKQKNLLENQKLTELRDWLLPMLMNGQVKVS